MSDIKREISQKYQVLNADGVALRGLFVIDKEVFPFLFEIPCIFILCRGLLSSLSRPEGVPYRKLFPWGRFVMLLVKVGHFKDVLSFVLPNIRVCQTRRIPEDFILCQNPEGCSL